MIPNVYRTRTRFRGVIAGATATAEVTGVEPALSRWNVRGDLSRNADKKYMSRDNCPRDARWRKQRVQGWCAARSRTNKERRVLSAALVQAPRNRTAGTFGWLPHLIVYSLRENTSHSNYIALNQNAKLPARTVDECRPNWTSLASARNHSAPKSVRGVQRARRGRGNAKGTPITVLSARLPRFGVDILSDHFETVAICRL